MLYKDPLRDFANYMGHDLYILPSSIHEVILLLDDEYVQSSEELREMVRETNRMVVDRRDQELSGTSVVSGDILSKLFKGTGIIRYDERYRQNLSRTSGWILSG